MELKDRVCLITGAANAIGRITAMKLASLGAVLIITVRDNATGELLKKDILKNVPDARIYYFLCNHSSFSSIRNFAAEFSKKFHSLHVLINNDGTKESTRDLSDDGIEKHLALNYLAPFLLTNLLLPQLKSGAPARIINVSAEEHRHADIKLDDLELEKKYSADKAYRQSKLAAILFTKKLSQKLKGSGVTANCLHPGQVPTGLSRLFPPLLRKLILLNKPQRDAETIIYLASSAEVEKISGEYFANSQKKKPGSNALRQDIADKLWAISEKYVGINT